MLIALLIVSCDSKRIYESDIDFENEVWHMDSVSVFEFNIEDRIPKNLAVKLRNDLTYPYQNLYLNYKLKDSGGNVLNSELVNLRLFDEKTGKPQGKGNSVYQFKEVVLKDFVFPGAGFYTIEFSQYMRVSALSGTYSIGLRVEDSE